MRTVLVIINPIAGVRPKDEIPDLVRTVMPRTEGFDLEIRFTERAGHASEMALDAVCRGVDTVVAIGGDGTINETARSLVGSEVKFGIVPMGSGNGLARHMQIPLDLRKALECIRDGYSTAVDYGTVNDHIFFCTAGIGFDAQVSARFAEVGTRGPITYLRSFVELVGDYKPSTYVIYTDDGRVREKAFMIAIGNASQWGNNAYITPHASMSDGLLDVTLVKPMPLYEIPRMALQLFSRELDKNPNTEYFRSSSLRIFMPHPDVVHVDGEPIQMEGILDVKVHEGAIRIITPENPVDDPLEPIRYAFEDIHYSILGNLKKGVRQLEELNRRGVRQLEVLNRRGVRQLEELNRPVLQAAENLAKPVIKAREQFLDPLLHRSRPVRDSEEDPTDEPMEEP